jgi:hypothetical protein
VTQSFTLTVDQAPAVTSANATTFTVGTAGSFAVTATGFPAPAFSEAGTLPAAVSFAANGTLSGTPATGTGGTYSLTITASNGVGSPVTQSFTLTVDQAPAVTSANATTFTVGTAGSFAVTATGFPAPAFSEAGTLPPNVVFSASGVLQGTPALHTVGTYPLTITAHNGVAPDVMQNFTLTVNGEAPSISWAAPGPINYGTALSATQLDATAPVPGSFSYSPAAGTVLSAGNQLLSVTFTPTDTSSYAVATAGVSLVVNKAVPQVSWKQPATMLFGVPLGSSQLNATSSIPGTFTYKPATGTVLSVGKHTLSALFTPSDSTDYAAVTTLTTVTVKPSPTHALLTFTTPVVVGSEDAANFMVTVTATSGGSPGGKASVRVSGTTLCNATITAGRGTCTLTASQLSAGSYAVTALFTGNVDYRSSTSSASTLAVNAAGVLAARRGGTRWLYE